jgi:hypothetical protein
VSYPRPKDGVGLKTIAVDIDGTLAEPTWPSPILGAPIQAVVDAAAEAYRDGFEIIVFTARPASHVPAIRGWLMANGLDFVYDIVTGKPRAASYWDDRAVTYPEGFDDAAD